MFHILFLLPISCNVSVYFSALLMHADTLTILVIVTRQYEPIYINSVIIFTFSWRRQARDWIDVT